MSNQRFSVGDTILHQTYGYGVVQVVYSGGMIEVLFNAPVFNDNRTLTVQARYCVKVV